MTLTRALTSEVGVRSCLKLKGPFKGSLTRNLNSELRMQKELERNVRTTLGDLLALQQISKGKVVRLRRNGYYF